MPRLSFILLFLPAVALGKPYQDYVQDEINRVPDLSDCKAYYLRSHNGWNEPSIDITVIRCKNSETTTSYRQGKQQVQHTITDSE
jgi:hypothetical protein